MNDLTTSAGLTDASSLSTASRGASGVAVLDGPLPPGVSLPIPVMPQSIGVMPR